MDTEVAHAKSDASQLATAGFDSLGLDARLVEALAALGYEEPTPIQGQAIPTLLAGRDLVGQAATGTGKTAAFALPLLHRLATDGPGAGPSPSSLVLVPTRELAMQVSEAIHRYGRGIGVRVLPVYGGQAFAQQLKVLKRGVDVVVATPGRALDHIRRGTLALDGVATVVLDEADEMLDMGFAEDLEAILAATPVARQTVLFSATIPPRIAAIARQHLRDPVRLELGRAAEAAGEQPQVRQTAYVVSRAHKPATLGRVLDMESPEAAIVFCRTRTEVDEVTERLNGHGYRAEAIHGGLSQEQRDRVMKKLRSGAAELLVATDVAARGLDIPQLTHVINYDVPSAPEAYVHRIGRVGRAGREGVAVTLVEPREHRLLGNIERLTRRKIEVARVPTLADLEARRLDLLRASLRETLLAGDLDDLRVVVASLADEFDLMEIALAAVKLAQQASGTEGAAEEVEIPAVSPPAARAVGERRPPPHRPRDDKGAARRGGPQSGVVRLFVGAGRAAGVRPQDLVGAITGEAGITGRQIGTIEIGERHSIVEVAEEVADQVVTALRRGKIRQRKVTVRRDRDSAGVG
ncbi:MAG TPA: DEAD/DEAH box helicase [Thermoanaerobaculia bacterium]|nr:DEAD/DEAH box helicase [Thermoanaerobaculia bacterium]